MSVCMEASQLMARPGGPHLIMKAVELAVRACRCDIETECVEVEDDTGARWFDTSNSLFSGSCENDIEFRAMRDEALRFLDDMGQMARHPQFSHWVRFEVPRG